MKNRGNKKIKRTTQLIAEFDLGYAKGWKFAVRSSFRKEMDILKSKRKIKNNETGVSEEVDVWTQGPFYCFEEGQVFYDIPDGYAEWESALKKINIACQITSAKPKQWLKTEDSTVITHGEVRAQLYKPNNQRTSLVKKKTATFTQDEFVDFLKNGTFPNASTKNS